MADINSISKRIDRLEYYTSLSLLEQATSSLLVRSDNTGQNRFKNGILVDPFKDHTIGDTANPKYTIAIDREKSEARPYFMQMTVGMNFDAEASTAVRRGALIMLPYTANNINQSQPFASKYRNCIEGNIFNYRGTVTLNPAAITDSDITQNPVINGNLDLYTNFMTKTTSKRSAFGSEWGNWSNYGSPSVVQSSSETRLSGSKTMPGRIENTFTETTTKTLAQQQVQVNKNLVVNRTENTVELGNFVSDVSIQPFVPARQVYFEARGLKPNCRLYVFFDRVNVTDRCMQIVRYRGSIETIGGVNYTAAGNRCYFSPYGDKFRTVGDWTAPLYSDDNGNIFGVFAIPAGIFKAGDLQFKITDIPNQLEGEDAVTTQASTTLFCAALSLEKTRANLTVISPQLDIEEEKQFRTVYQDVITDRTWTSIETVTIVDEPVDNGPVDGGGDGGDGGDDGVVQDNETDVTPDGGDDGTVTILPTDTGDEVVVSTPEIVTPPIVEISDSVVVCYDMPPPVEDNTSWQGDYSENTNEAAVDASQTGTDTPGDGDDAGDSAGAGDAAGGDDGGGGGAG
jgi:hypothetical protein